MSTTMPFSSSRGEKNATRTTNVAPWSFCAGPKTSPQNECAIMIWSETSTAYTGVPHSHMFLRLSHWADDGRRCPTLGHSRIRVGDQRTDDLGISKDLRQPLRQLLEG